MADEEKYLEGVFRQRRNFLLASALFAAFLFLDIEFSEIQIFGVKFILHNKENLLWVVFAWWGYLFWRYFQYHREMRDKAISEDYNSIIFAVTQPIIERQARKAFPDFLNSHDASYYSLKPIAWNRSTFTGKFIFRIPDKEPPQNEMREVTFDISRLRFIPAHLWAFLRVLFANHHVSDYLLPYAIAVVLAMVFVAKVNVSA